MHQPEQRLAYGVGRETKNLDTEFCFFQQNKPLYMKLRETLTMKESHGNNLNEFLRTFLEKITFEECPR